MAEGVGQNILVPSSSTPLQKGHLMPLIYAYLISSFLSVDPPFKSRVFTLLVFAQVAIISVRNLTSMNPRFSDGNTKNPESIVENVNSVNTQVVISLAAH